MKKTLSIIVNVVAWIVLILAFLITIVVFSSGRNNGVANLMGYIPMTVASDSMKPTFNKGDLIVCREVDDINSLKEGDVITFWTVIDGSRVKNTHRIVGVNEFESTRSFVTRGDNNSLDDTLPAYASDVIGKWTNVKLAGLGKVMDFLRTKTGFFVCILIPMALFFLFELYKFIVTLIEVKRPDNPEIDEEEIKRRAVEEYLASQKKDAADPVEEAAEKLEKAAEAAAGTAGNAADKISDAAEKAADKAEDIKNEAAEKMEKAAETAGNAVDKISDAAEKAADNAENIKDEAVEKTENAADAIKDTVEDKTEETAGKIMDAASGIIENAAEKLSETAEKAIGNTETAE